MGIGFISSIKTGIRYLGVCGNRETDIIFNSPLFVVFSTHLQYFCDLKKGQRCTAVVECLLSMCKALGSIIRAPETEQSKACTAVSVEGLPQW